MGERRYRLQRDWERVMAEKGCFQQQFTTDTGLKTDKNCDIAAPDFKHNQCLIELSLFFKFNSV